MDVASEFFRTCHVPQAVVKHEDLVLGGDGHRGDGSMIIPKW